MSLDAVLRPNLVVLAGLCLLLCVADIRFLRCRKPSANPGLTRQHVLLGLLSLLCSLVCTFDIILFARKETCDQLASIFVGSLWAMVSFLRLCYLAVPMNRRFCLVNGNLLGLALFLTTTLPEQICPLLWIHVPGSGDLSVSNTIQLATAFASAIFIPIVTPGNRCPSENGFHPSKLCSPVSRWWLYTWVSPVVDKGHNQNGVMSPEDLLSSEDHSAAWLERYSNCHQMVSFRATLWKLFRRRLAVTAFWAASCGFFELIGTIGLHQLLLFLQRSPETRLRPWFSILLFGSCPILRGLCMQTFEHIATHTIGDGKACMTTAVYEKLMALQADTTVDLGQLQSNISADIDRLGTLRYTMMTGFMVPVELIVASILLYRIMGWYYLPSLAFLLVTRYPLSKFIISAQGKVQSRVLQATDKRITKTSESIRAMAAIKILGHVQPFIQRILGERNQELEAIWQRMQVIVASESLSSTMSFLALLLCLLLYTVVGEMPLQPDVVFTVVAIFNTVNSMLGLSVLGAGQYAQATVSLDRLSKFLDQPDFQLAIEHTKNDADGTASRDMGSITIQPHEGSRDITGKLDIEFVPFGLNAIAGDVGSGKTLLLQSLLSDGHSLQKAQFEPIAYASQSPWLFRGSIKDNILFGAPFDPERYRNVIRSCSLEPDLATFKDGDMKDVGESGRRLSGGQRQRVTLARAVYSNTGTVVLDDVLSGLDPITFEWIVGKCIFCPEMKGRTIFIASNSDMLLERADMVVYMKDGAVNQTARRSPSKGKNAIDGDNPLPIPAIDLRLDCRESDHAEGSGTDDNKDTPDGLDNLRERIGSKYMAKYIQSFGGRSFIAIVAIFTIAAQAMEIVMPAWLSAWSQAYISSQSPNLGFFIGIFSGLGFVEVLLLAISLVLLYSGAWRASRDKHLEMSTVVFGATYAWIWRTPAGQMINRFSSDMASLDETLFRTFRPVVETYLSITLRILTVSSLIPLFLIPAIALTGLALYIGYRYRSASTAVKHMYAGSLTPLHHGVSETASGLMTIHAFRAEKLLQDRFNTAVDHHVRAWNAVCDLQRWLAVRMDLCVGMISFSVAVLAVMQEHTRASTVGLSLTLTTGLCTALLYLVYLSSLLEVEMTSYYRIETYIKNLPQESRPRDPDAMMPEWPTQGTVDIRNLTAGYSLDESEVLKDVSFSAQSGERVAIVGRTGSGKSSLALSLLRLTTLLHGSIIIDGVDVESLGIDQLRQRISLIPQDPTLFDGTMRFNLDPSGRISDEHLQTVLDDVVGAQHKWHLGDPVADNGRNFSHGERQLIVLARAIVSQNRIVILDEGTASLDPVSEARIHAALRDRFHDCTVITITHRLHGVVDFDQVLVLDRGQVVEQGGPRKLLTAGEGWFRTLYMQQNGPSTTE